MLRNLHKRKLFILLVKGGGAFSGSEAGICAGCKVHQFSRQTYEIFRACSWYSIVHAKIGLNPIWRHGHPHRRRRRQPVEARQRVRQNHQKHVWNMFYIQFFKRNRLGMVSNMSEASKSCSSTSTTSTRPSPTSAIHVFDDFDELAVVLPLAVFVLFLNS